MELKQMSSDGKIAYLIKPILKVLQEAGGQLSRSEIKERIADMDEQIAEFAEMETISKLTGKPYKDFGYRFNFALKDLAFLNILTYKDMSPITLTEQGLNLNIDVLDVQKDVIEGAKQYWVEKSKKNRTAKTNSDIETEVEPQEEENIQDDFKADKVKEAFETELLSAIAKMSPKKFEAFSRALLTKMGVEFTEKGVQISNDGGIDGYGYHMDTNDFRTTRVVIQCKRYNSSAVTEPEINQFLGAMSKFRADYGVFITNGRFTNAAKQAAREGAPITLIDGNELVRLVKRYELYIKPVTTYVLDSFYDSEE